MNNLDQALQTLNDVFRFDDFKPGQRDVISVLLGVRSAAAVFPTGGGKSLCYQLPALLLPGLTLVVSPLIALMKDQIDQLKALGVAAERLDSSLSLEQYREVMTGVREGTLKLLYVAPERFNNERFREVMKGTRLSLMAVDEAHCISEWGHNFRPDYLKLAEFARRYGAERVLALTATATPQVLDDIRKAFQIDSEDAVRTGFYRPNLTLLTTAISHDERDQGLLKRVKERIDGPAIVYVTLQKTAMQVAELLHNGGVEAQAYHAGMKTEERTAVQDWFLGSDSAVVVATIAFGMGIDKSNIRTVIHYNQPKSLENLAQEIGRAGRDGLPSRCELFFCPNDLDVLRNFAYGDTPSLQAVRDLLGALLSERDHFEVSLYDLAARFDIRQLVVRTLLTHLELDGHLEEGTPRFTSYRFRFLNDRDSVLEKFNPDRQLFLGRLFDCAKQKKVWSDIDLDSAAQTTRSPRDRLVRALDYLADQGDIELRTGGIRHRLTWLGRPNDSEAAALELHQRLLNHERRELHRLDEVLALAQEKGCQTNLLCQHFGEDRNDPCGHCSFCLSATPMELLETPSASIPDEVWQELDRLRQAFPDVLSDSRAMARFAAGLPSPTFTRQRMRSQALFGCLATTPFSKLLERAESTTLKHAE